MAPYRLTSLLATALAFPLWLAACDNTDPLAPPVIVFGEDVCVRCGMIISDERFAAAAIVHDGDRFQARLFDDVGCLLADGSHGTGAAVRARYVRSAVSRQWLDFDDARFVHGVTIMTPMAFGIAACADATEVRTLRTEHDGDLFDVTELQARFDAGDLTPQPGAAGRDG